MYLLFLSFNIKIPNLLFYGPPGSGKTSAFYALAKSIFGPKYKSRILELNASDDRGIDIIRTKIKNFSRTKCKDAEY